MKSLNFQSIALAALLLLNTGILVLMFRNEHRERKAWMGKEHGNFSHRMHPTTDKGENFSTGSPHGKGRFKKNHPPYRGEMGFLNPQLMKELNLSEDQQTNIKALRDKQHASMEKNREESMKLKKELFRLAINDQSDQKQIDAVVEKIGQQEKIIAIERVKFFQSLQQILTPEQKQKVVEFRRQNKEE